MSMAVQLSVVITTYNYGRYIEGCIESVLRQTYKDYEIVLIDDGSTDDTEKRIAKYLSLPNFKYVKQQNGGQARAKNRGIKESQGRLIAFLDADDLWREDKLEKQVPLFADPSIGVVYSDAKLIDSEGILLNLKYEGRYLVPRRGQISGWLFFDNFIWFSSSVVRRECFEKYGYFDESLPMGIDWDRWLNFSVYFDFDYIDEELLFYRHGHSGQMSKNRDLRFECADRIMGSFIEKFPATIDTKIKQEALFATYCGRGYYYCKISCGKALSYFGQALRIKPLSLSIYKGIIKTLIYRLMGEVVGNNLSEYLSNIKADAYRYIGQSGHLFKLYFSTPGFHYTFWLRTTLFLKSLGVLGFPLYALSRLLLRRLQFKYGISIPYNTQIGKGLYIGHYGGIVVNSQAKIGCNCNINQGVTIGATYGGKNPGTPVIGDNVYIGPGSFVIGGITLGSHVAIGANTVVNKSIPDNGVVASSPGEIISHKGSGNYVINTDNKD